MAEVKKNTAFVGVSQLLRILMALILLPFAARILGDESFGRYNLATTIMFFVMLVDDFGLNMWITREIAKYRDRAQRYFAYTVGLKIFLIAASLLFVALFLKFTPYDSQTIKAIWIFALYGILTSFRDLAVAIFRAHEDMVWEAVVVSIERVLITVLGVLVLLNGGGVLALAWAFVVSSLISLTVSAVILFPRFLHLEVAFNLNEFIPIFKGASVFGISMFLTTIYSRIDMMMLSVMKEPAVWGWYAAAHKLVDFTNVVPTVLMIATFPTLSRFSVSISDQLSFLFTRGFKYLLILAIPLIPGVILLSDPIITLYYGGDFLQAIPALKILSFTAAILFINIFAAGLYGATNNQHKIVLIQILGLILNVCMNYVLIPKMAHVGAALATVVTESIVVIITLGYAFNKFVHLTEKRFILHIIFATIVMAVFLFVLKDFHIFFIIITGVMIYFSILLLFKTVTIREIMSFRRHG